MEVKSENGLYKIGTTQGVLKICFPEDSSTYVKKPSSRSMTYQQHQMTFPLDKHIEAGFLSGTDNYCNSKCHGSMPCANK